MNQISKPKLSTGVIIALSAMGLVVIYAIYKMAAPSVKPIPNVDDANKPADTKDPNALTYAVKYAANTYEPIRTQPNAAASWVLLPASGEFVGQVSKAAYDAAKSYDWIQIQTVGLGLGYVKRSEIVPNV